MAIRECGRAVLRATRSRSAVTSALLSALLAGFGLLSLPSAAMAQVGTLTAINSGAFPRSAAGAGSGQLALLDMVVLVDESGSETPAKVADEKATTSEIVTSLLNSHSRVTVIGFGGVNHLAPDQDPTDVACQPTIANPANYGYLTTCVDKLHRRTELEGDDTDYAAALGQAMSYFNPQTAAGQQSPSGATKVILMMTDGAVDVHRNTQQYGTDWQLGELTQIDDQLAIARSEHVQFWALGFGVDIGTNVDGTSITKAQALAYLNAMAAKGAPAVCDGQRASVQPYAQWVNNPDDAFTTLGQLNADASCAGYNSNQKLLCSAATGGSASGSTTVQIPEIASGGVISVDRVNPAVQVTFTQPDGQPWTDSAALSGQDTSPVESLHLPDITSGEVGTWTINLTAPAGLGCELVRASALWQGVVRAEISANPTTVKLGQPICSVLSLLGPRGPVSNAAAIPSLRVGVTVSGDGLSQQQVPVSGSGQAGCPTTGAGQYAGTITAPDTSGVLTFTGIAAGYGLSTTYVPAMVTVGPVAAPFTAVIQYPADPADRKVQAGSGLAVAVVFTNNTGTPQKVLLAVSGNGTSPSIAGTSIEQTVPAGSRTVPFYVMFPANSTPGLTLVQVAVAEAANPDQAIASAPFDVTVTKPPGFWAQYLWDVIAAVIVLILLALFVLWRRAVNRWRMDVRGLVAYLRRDGSQVAELKAKSRGADSFLFTIRDPEESAPRLDYEESGLPVYTVRRSGNRELRLTTPAGRDYEPVVLGETVVPIEETKLQLAFTEDRKRPVPWWARRTDRGPRRRRKKRTRRSVATTEQHSPAKSAGPTETEVVSPVETANQEQPANNNELW